MKPHFGQSDAAMNKLAGCNSFPNAGKTFDLTELEQKARAEGFETPFQMMAAKNMTEHMTPEPLTKGYYGHEDGCDCAVCENMYFHELHLNRVAADIEAIKQNAYQAGFNAAKRDCVEILEKMPSRVEPISGQNFAYIKKYVAIDAIQQLGI